MDNNISIALLVLVFFASLTLMFGCVQGAQAGQPSDGTASGGTGVSSNTGGTQAAPSGASPQSEIPSAGIMQNATGNSTGFRNQGQRGAMQRGNFTGAEGQPTQRGNLTEAERQQMDAARISACSGMSEGDACKMTTPRGVVNGTCQSQNSTQGTQIVCGFGGNGFGRQGGLPTPPNGGQ